MQTYTKQSGDQLDFDVDFSDWLPNGATIQTVSVSVDIPTKLSLLSYQNNNPIIKVWLAGGVDGNSYIITVTAATNIGHIKVQEFRLRIKDL